MGFFKNAAAEWEKTMTENDLDKMEAQGLDVSAYRAKLAARRAKEAEEAKEENKDKELYWNPTNLDRLSPYIQTPRSTETEFFKKMAGKAPWFGKKTWLKSNVEGLIVYVSIIDAPEEVWKGTKHEDDGHYIVGVYALDEEHIRNVEWLQKVAATLRSMYEGKQTVDPAYQGIMDMIPDESNWNTINLRGSLAEGADAYVCRLVLFDKNLPQGYLPTNGIVPHFYWEGAIQCIPAELYV